MKNSSILGLSFLALFTMYSVSCKKNSSPGGGTNGNNGKDTLNSPKVSVDRFSDAAGTLYKRSDPTHSFPFPGGTFPAPNAAINFDQVPFLVHGFDANGDSVIYYNFDTHANGAATDILYHFYYQGDTTNVISQQLAIVNSLPGESTYNDFWQLVKVVVPKNYVPNSVTSEDEIFKANYQLIPTTCILNCPIVPFGSTASLRLNGGVSGTLKGWIRDSLFAYFTFQEAPTKGVIRGSGTSNPGAIAPVDSIYVFFADNQKGPGSGFDTVAGSKNQEHNVVGLIPGQIGYSALWSVNVVDNSVFDKFGTIHSINSINPNILAHNVALVNCPVVEIKNK